MINRRAACASADCGPCRAHRAAGCRPRLPACAPSVVCCRCTPTTPCRPPPPTMRIKVAPRAQGSPSMATIRPAAASSPPTISGEGGDQRVGRGWGLPVPRLRLAWQPRRHHGQHPSAWPCPGHISETHSPCAVTGPHTSFPPKDGPGPPEGYWRLWGMGQPPLFLEDTPFRPRAFSVCCLDCGFPAFSPQGQLIPKELGEGSEFARKANRG